jgi:hypothetical protein
MDASAVCIKRLAGLFKVQIAKRLAVSARGGNNWKMAFSPLFLSARLQSGMQQALSDRCCMHRVIIQEPPAALLQLLLHTARRYLMAALNAPLKTPLSLSLIGPLKAEIKERDAPCLFAAANQIISCVGES